MLALLIFITLFCAEEETRKRNSIRSTEWQPKTTTENSLFDWLIECIIIMRFRPWIRPVPALSVILHFSLPTRISWRKVLRSCDFFPLHKFGPPYQLFVTVFKRNEYENLSRSNNQLTNYTICYFWIQPTNQSINPMISIFYPWPSILKDVRLSSWNEFFTSNYTSISRSRIIVFPFLKRLG